MIEALKQKLGDEVEKLQHELNVTLPNEIRKAVELGDLRENSEYKAALERQQFVQARLGQLRQRLSKLSQIDMTQIPTDRVGLGSRVVVKDGKSVGDVTMLRLPTTTRQLKIVELVTIHEAPAGNGKK